MRRHKELGAKTRTVREVVNSSGLNPMQADFCVKHVVDGLTRAEAARAAGFTHAYSSLDLLKNKSVRDCVNELRKAVIETDGVAIAWKTMQNLMTAAEVPHNVRFNAARWTLEAGGQGIAAKLAQAKIAVEKDKPLSEMTLSELEAFIQKGTSALKTIQEYQAPVMEMEQGEEEESEEA